MADPKDKPTTPASDGKAARSAAVKPPVLEGKARPPETNKLDPLKAASESDTSAKPAAGPGDKPALATKPEPKGKPDLKPALRPTETRQASTGPMWLAGFAGGVLGLGGAYALAMLGYWPTQPAPAQPADPRLAAISTAVPELQSLTSTTQGEVAALADRVAALEGVEPAEPNVDLEPLNAALAALSARVDSLSSAAVAPGEVNSDNIEAIATLETNLEALRAEASGAASAIESLSSRLAAIEDAQQASASVADSQVRLPLILSGFETAFAGGRSYDGELAALRQVLPDLSVPETVAAGAMTGLKRPDAVIAAFDAALPDILAARPLDGDAGWQGATADWFRGVIALRPTGDVDGDGPEALVAQVEAALLRRDFAAAQSAFSRLPQAMQDAAGPVAADLAAQAAAEAFLLALRQASLGTGGPA